MSLYNMLIKNNIIIIKINLPSCITGKVYPDDLIDKFTTNY